ncbi:MAG: type I DNA topoisomerase [Candidatus Shapirobacteria bacterium]|nr:type I DNA topoisomerase [Candidatus Shapirobacteria bacterium]
MKSLVIVESPTKAKTLSNFLGKDYEVVSTMGHIRDLPEKKLGIKVEEKKGKYKFILDYVSLPKKEETIKKLKQAANKKEKIFLATDPDREGEAIAWHTAQILSGNGKQQMVRVAFHEITKSAIEKALNNPGEINFSLVDAQQARRVLDRLVGYKLSPLLWRKIRRGLSAGRVQSVTVRLIVDREREIEKFIPEEYWEIWADLKKHIGGLKDNIPPFSVKLVKLNGKNLKVENETQTKQILEELKDANYEVGKVEKKEIAQKPIPPFTTSTLQQRAVSRLGFSSKRTMRIAQFLYEKGLITYHRTDSLNLAEEAVSQIRQFIKKNYGADFLAEKPRFYKTKSKVAQEAHEAIRPTDVNRQPEEFSGENRDEERLYDLIWRRALACQMAAAIWDQTKIDVQAAGLKNIYNLVTEGKIIKFSGWMKLYEKINQETLNNTVAESILPEVKAGDDLDLIKLKNEQKFTQPPARYTEATLIKALEERGIGRPSTYAPTVSTIEDRQYVEKNEGKFKPSVLGITVNDFLIEYFPEIFDYQFTAKMEDELDDIANGKLEWEEVIGEFYAPFEKKLGAVNEVAERVQVPTEAIGEKCPECKEGELVIRVGKFGKFISCSRFPDCKYSAPFIQNLEGVVCPKCGNKIVIKKTRKGKQFYGCANYPKCDWASWRKPTLEKP